MSELVKERVTQCFSTVFPRVPATGLTSLSTSLHGGWDSMMTINLAALLEEEFTITFSLDEIEEFLSYELVVAAVMEKLDD